ncbi:pimeloyl-ACP methyl ester carboxylesterase [Thermocatellispora tengchongensis]|uniref:Pimeloyl-ACP methyl ester carboxylesterase n=2 Tax=Thermocatellispora tengchongensis TaxID=1073253 RepID=A0A840NVT7_9ACTN|nr:alpha/beta hydrolase [Thermocatellispora tengchongensis]MBB5132914.1 pimeloyl-ACP methyl ester carboxylesterase [Thermocatellispora tengchongensis]
MAGLTLTTAVSAMGTAPTAAAAEAAAAPARWRACAEPAPQQAPLQCTTISVPLDHRIPHGPKIDIAVSRLAARDQAERRGVLLINPGGPGIAGLGAPALVSGNPALKDVAEHYDLVGFDPRGTGASSPIDCGLDDRQVRQAQLPWPQPGGFDADAALARATAQACVRRAGAMLPHLTTENTARDIDAIRSMLGERKISYLGVSYGTYLGAVYATLFPTRVDKLVLDSVMAPEGPSYRTVRSTAQAVDARFTDLAAWLAERHATYSLGETEHQVRARILALLRRLAKQPEKVGDVEVTPASLRSLLYMTFAAPDASLFPDTAGVVGYLTGAPGAPPEATVAQRLARATMVPPTGSATASAMLAVTCAGRWPRDPAAYRRDSLSEARAFPVTGGGLSNIRPCAYWPGAPGQGQVPRIGGRPVEVLMLQNLRDPVTPYAGAVRMRLALGARTRLVTVDAAGHGVADLCAVSAASAWLVDGTLPREDVRCPGRSKAT